MKKLFLAVLTVLSVITINNTVVKADDMREYFEADELSDAFSCGYMTLEDHTKGADFSLGFYENDEVSENGLTYYKIINENTVKLVDVKNSSGNCHVDADYITYNGVTYRNIVIGNFKNNKKIKEVYFQNVDTVVIKSKSAFENSSVERVTLKGCKEIPANCFKNCKNLKGVYIEDAHKLKTFGKTSFYNCYNLTYVTLESKYFSTYNATVKYMKKHGRIEWKDNVFGASNIKKTKLVTLTVRDNSGKNIHMGGYPSTKIVKYNVKKQQRTCQLGYME